MISIRNLSHSFGDWPVLHDINLELKEQRIAFIGANGNGKSTLARMLNGLLIPQQGDVVVNGVEVRRHPVQARQRVGFIFSDADSQIIMPTVAEDVALGLRRFGYDKLRTQREVDALLARFGLQEHGEHSAHLLSGGQKQMLALASVLATQPQILICDEPTTLLDLHNVEIFVDTLRRLEQQVILLTHQLEIIEDFDRVVVIDRGRVFYDGPPAEAVSRYRALIRARRVPQELSA
ncbi:ABC transporter ATP-binding protein [Pseudomonas sp. PDM23]|uniref:energy-coupling factor ABC transporter ATP-binding protein n=1 Tax=unclassified Pseudomonas TaxID=196821 RepID=UPI00177B4E7E|nr:MULTISPECIES: ABC transporter ATP-binding protein [unclassified Pseudomonas]MBD9579189.1 ABC transporter ATP-binding protein [Pseudomonas sp. PDM23]MBD9672825.1 ABC transporter ATP-binding protein [Pseudomonas sp. PDM21]